MRAGDRVQFQFYLHRVTLADPIETRFGEGLVIDFATDHGGACLDDSWCRVRVTGAAGSYRPGEVVLCRTWNCHRP